jgi:hypothetical protein
MEKISIEGTPKTPTVTVDLEKGFMEIKGRSIPENSTEFYLPIMNSLKDFLATKKGNITVNFKLEYFNTSSSKCILDILKSLSTIQKSGSTIVINWYYEEDDEDMLESGDNYQEIVNLPFNMILVHG